MQVTGSNKISIQVSSLNGFSINNGCARSGWLGADRVFTSEELQRRYDEVEISVFTPKFSLVPASFFNESQASGLLGGTVTLDEGDEVRSVRMPEFGAVAIYSVSDGGTLARVLRETVLKTDGSRGELYPEQYYLLKALSEIGEYNKIVASYADGYLYLVVAQGRTLLLCNAFKASDFTTAQYFIFMVMRKFQLNPEVSSIWFRTPLAEDEEMSLYNYFKSVESLGK
ncbi:MAG: DUF3822 family protein [Bacteroidales bacterium]|nr:DUF3822 family protein [Bacteroidales bacterium]